MTPPSTYDTTVTFGRAEPPKPEDFEVAVTLTWLSKTAGIAVADARVRAEHPGARTYWLKILVGPDGYEVLDNKLKDPVVSITADGLTTYQQHGFTYEQVVQAIYSKHRDQAGAS